MLNVCGVCHTCQKKTLLILLPFSHIHLLPFSKLPLGFQNNVVHLDTAVVLIVLEAECPYLPVQLLKTC